jgi:hypothetical protein
MINEKIRARLMLTHQALILVSSMDVLDDETLDKIQYISDENNKLIAELEEMELKNAN